MLARPRRYQASLYRLSLSKARRYMMDASLYFPRSKYLFPLATYFLLVTFGSNLQPASKPTRVVTTNKPARFLDILFTHYTINNLDMQCYKQIVPTRLNPVQYQDLRASFRRRTKSSRCYFILP